MNRRVTWHRGWTAAVLLAVTCACAVGAWTALGRTLRATSTSQPLPGSQFQGGDGDQADAGGFIDWQGLQLDGRVGHTSDPQAHDNVFTGGSKELQPGNWGLTTQNGGSTPASGNILDIYRAVDHPPDGDVFLYLALTREASNGTIYVTFELNQDARLWTNSAGAQVPCRTTGDLLLSFDDQGNVSFVQAQRWVSDTTDPATGCARTGHLDSATGLTADDVQASFNYTSPIANYLPGFYDTSIPALRFGETAINLSTVLSDLGDPCGVFGSTWAHSRSSLSDTADMKDYVAPEPFHVRTCKANPALSTAASGTVNRRAHRAHRLRRHRVLRATTSLSDTAHLSDGDNPTGTITFHLYGPDDPTCSAAPVFTSTVTASGNGYYQSGAFTPTRVGTYRWRAEYSGDDNNHPAGPTACGEDTETVAVSPASPTLSSDASGRGRRGHGARAAQPIYDTADLEGGFAPTGTITFRLFGPHDPTCSRRPIFRSQVPVDGNGRYNSAPFTPDGAGTYRWVVSYSGDDNNHPAGPTACGVPEETVVLEPAHPALTTVASGAADLGQPISDAATLTGGADPTGRITFHAYGPDDATCSGPPAHSSTVTVSGNGTYHAAAFTPGAVGTYRWVAHYSGDRNNAAAGPTDCADPAEAVVVSHPVAQPDLATTASAGAPAGSAIYDTAHLSGGSDPTGTITFRAYGPDNPSCAAPPAATSTVSVTGNGDYRSAAFTPTKAGTYRWIAVYSGDDGNHAAGPTACDDAAEMVVVTQATPALRTVAVPGVPIGSGIRDRALLSGGSQPGGTITFRLYGPNDPTCSGSPVFTAHQTVVGNGAYSSGRFAPSQTGTYLWVATYSGDANNRAAGPTACGDPRETAIVAPRRPLLTTSASPPGNVLRSARRARAVGQSIYDAATLRRGFAPTGQITFTLFGPDNPGCSGAPVFTSSATVNGNGVYNSARFTPTASGLYRWRATYSGDANNRGAGPTRCGISSEEVHVTVPSAPQLATSASAAVTLGGAVHDTAHLSGGAAPTGTITFRLYGVNDTACSRSPVFTSTVRVDGNGDYVSESFTPGAAGAYRWTAVYSGDNANHPAGPTACGDGAETAVVRPPSITPTVPSFSTTASQEPPGGASLFDIAHLGGGIDPRGAITFELFGPDNPRCTGQPAFSTTVVVDGNGDYRSAAFDVPSPGTYRWVAVYSGDALNAAAGPTACGDPAETVTASSSEGPETGPNVPTPPKPPRPKPKPKPPPPPPPPRVTG